MHGGEARGEEKPQLTCSHQNINQLRPTTKPTFKGCLSLVFGRKLSSYIFSYCAADWMRNSFRPSPGSDPQFALPATILKLEKRVWLRTAPFICSRLGRFMLGKSACVFSRPSVPVRSSLVRTSVLYTPEPSVFENTQLLIQLLAHPSRYTKTILKRRQRVVFIERHPENRFLERV